MVNDDKNVITDTSENMVIKSVDIPTDTPNVLEQHIPLEETADSERPERKAIKDLLNIEIYDNK